ncbi:MAG: hypothetical protein D6722_00010, partial [Bacteroidetes bacterium]
MKSLTFLLLLALLWGSPLLAQESRMDQDLRMIRQVMEELFRTENPDPDHLRVSTRRTATAYTPGFGLVIHTPVYSEGHSLGGSYAYVIESNGLMIRKTDPHGEEASLAADELNDAVVDILKYFLSEYGDLPADLKSEDRILLVYDARPGTLPFGVGGVSWSQDEEEGERMRITALASVENIRAFRAGSLSETRFLESIDVSTGEVDRRAALSYRVLSKVLAEVYEAEKGPATAPSVGSEPGVIVFSDRQQVPRVSYEVLPGFGVSYKLKFESDFFPQVIAPRPGRVRISSGGEAVVVTEKEIRATGRDKQVEALLETTLG